MRVLVIEDDDAIAEPLERGLRHEGFDVTRAALGGDALSLIDSGSTFDVVLLDLGLPDMDGFSVCRQLRERSETPVIVVSARGDEVDRVVGLELGADDYVVKPFGFRELVARIRAVARRSGPERSTEEEARVDLGGGLVIDTRSRRVLRSGEEVPLTRKEFDLLALLAADPGASFTRELILERVWDPHWYGPTKTLDVHVAALRRKLGDPGIVETVRGVGFRLRVHP